MYNKKVTRNKKERKSNGKSKFWALLLDHIKFSFRVASVNGLNHITWKQRTVFERVFWTVIVIATATVGIMQGLEVWDHYQTRPTVVNVETDFFNKKFVFPCITICQRGFSRDGIKYFNSAMADRGLMWNKSVINYMEDLAFKNYYTYKDLKDYADGAKVEYLEPDDYIPMLTKLVNTLKINPKGRKLKTIFPLSYNRSIHLLLTENGLCSTINPKTAIYYTPDFLNNSKPYYGYEDMIYTNNDKFVSFITSEIMSKYSIYLHAANELPDIQAKPFNAPDGTVLLMKITSIPVRSTKDVEQLAIKQRQCRYSYEDDILAHSPVYSFCLCNMECRIQLCLKYCSCVPYYYRRLPGEKICNMSEMYCLSKYSDQLISLVDSITNQSLCSNCLQNCNSEQFIIKDYSVEKFFLDTRIVVEIGSVPSVIYRRTLLFSKMDVLVQIGGILGLFLGCSILSLTEIIYFMTLRFYWGIIGGRSIRVD